MAASEAASYRLEGCDYVAAIDFGTWGTAVAVCPATRAFSDGECDLCCIVW